MKKLYNILLISCLTISSITCKKDGADIPIGTIIFQMCLLYQIFLG